MDFGGLAWISHYTELKFAGKDGVQDEELDMGWNLDAGPSLEAWSSRSERGECFRSNLSPRVSKRGAPGQRISRNRSLSGNRIRVRPDEALSYNNLGMSLLLKEDPEKALRAFQEGTKIGGIPSKMHNNLALALCKVGRYPEALEALKKSGDEASAYYRLGNIYLAQGKYREAVKSFEKAIELKPAFHVKAYEMKRQALAALALSAGDATTER